MSESYLNAHHGICIGGMFFKVGDKVRVEGEGLNKHAIMYADGPIEYIMPEDCCLGIKVRPDWILIFDYNHIVHIEHVREEV